MRFSGAFKKCNTLADMDSIACTCSDSIPEIYKQMEAFYSVVYVGRLDSSQKLYLVLRGTINGILIHM
jgi:hypothetical protein